MPEAFIQRSQSRIHGRFCVVRFLLHEILGKYCARNLSPFLRDTGNPRPTKHQNNARCRVGRSRQPAPSVHGHSYRTPSSRCYSRRGKSSPQVRSCVEKAKRKHTKHDAKQNKYFVSFKLPPTRNELQTKLSSGRPQSWPRNFFYPLTA